MDATVPLQLGQLLNASDDIVRAAAWDKLIAGHTRLLLSVARSFGGGHDDAMDFPYFLSLAGEFEPVYVLEHQTYVSRQESALSLSSNPEKGSDASSQHKKWHELKLCPCERRLRSRPPCPVVRSQERGARCIRYPDWMSSSGIRRLLASLRFQAPQQGTLC